MVSVACSSVMLKNKVPLWNKIKEIEPRNKKCTKSHPTLNHSYAVKFLKPQIFRRKTQKPRKALKTQIWRKNLKFGAIG